MVRCVLSACPVHATQFSKRKSDLSSTVESHILRKTALNGLHRRLGAKMVDFGGWDMPVEYPARGGLMKEHLPVPPGGGMLDVSHMGNIPIPGPQATDTMD